MANEKLNVKGRDVIGKSSHKLAPEGLIPAIVYGPKIDATPVSVDRRELEALMHHAAVGSTLLDLSIDGGKPLNVIIKAIRHEEIKGAVQHVDFWAVDMGHALQTAVPINFVGTAAGEVTGGVVMHALHELHVEVRPKDLPEHIDVDVSALEVGDSLSVADLVAPKGVTLLDDPETVVASVTPPTMAVEEEVPAAAVTEVPEIGEEAEE